MNAKIKTMDIIAIILTIGYIALMYCGDGKDLSAPFALVIGFYFGHSVSVNTNTL